MTDQTPVVRFKVRLILREDGSVEIADRTAGHLLDLAPCDKILGPYLFDLPVPPDLAEAIERQRKVYRATLEPAP